MRSVPQQPTIAVIYTFNLYAQYNLLTSPLLHLPNPTQGNFQFVNLQFVNL